MFQKIAYTCYPVQNMARAVSFYREVLGLILLFTSEEWSEFKIGSQRLALHKTNAPFTAVDVPTFSLEASPIEEVVEKLKSLGVQLAQGIQVLSYGKLANFLDSEGNSIGLYEPPVKN